MQLKVPDVNNSSRQCSGKVTKPEMWLLKSLNDPSKNAIRSQLVELGKAAQHKKLVTEDLEELSESGRKADKCGDCFMMAMLLLLLSIINTMNMQVENR